jgi:multidrug efflux system membrane fusion protein
MKARTFVHGWPALLAAVSCSEGKPYEKPVTPVSVAEVSPHDTGATVRYSASVKPASDVTLSFRVGGYVDEILNVNDDRGRPREAQAGDRVSKGTALARVRASDYEQRVAQGTAGLSEAAAMQESARLDYERALRLYEQHSLTKPELEAARARADAAAARDVGARAGVAQAQIMLDDVTLRAPMDGVVLSRMIELGALLAPGQPAFRLADTSSVKVSFGVPDVVVGSLTIGRPQRIAFEALKGMDFEGRITFIAPSPDPVSRVYEIEVTIPNPKGQILVGFIASLQLADRVGTTVPTVPLEAIVNPPNRPGEQAVFVLDEQKDRVVARLRTVKLGEALGSLIVVTDGLTVGQKVVVRGATLINDGDVVRPVR